MSGRHLGRPRRDVARLTRQRPDSSDFPRGRRSRRAHLRAAEPIHHPPTPPRRHVGPGFGASFAKRGVVCACHTAPAAPSSIFPGARSNRPSIRPPTDGTPTSQPTPRNAKMPTRHFRLGPTIRWAFKIFDRNFGLWPGGRRSGRRRRRRRGAAHAFRSSSPQPSVRFRSPPQPVSTPALPTLPRSPSAAPRRRNDRRLVSNPVGRRPPTNESLTIIGPNSGRCVSQVGS